MLVWWGLSPFTWPVVALDQVVLESDNILLTVDRDILSPHLCLELLHLHIVLYRHHYIVHPAFSVCLGNRYLVIKPAVFVLVVAILQGGFYQAISEVEWGGWQQVGTAAAAGVALGAASALAARSKQKKAREEEA